MSKALGTKKVKVDTTPTKNLVSFLDSYDTTNVDKTLSNLSQNAYNQSQQLGNMGDYTFNVNGSDEARQRAEEATYQSYVDKLSPQFERQRTDYATMLQNQGIPVGSEAYSRAMGDLEEKQNDALTQAAYASVLNGQNAFSQSLGDEVNAGSFSNQAQQAYINQLLSQLEGSSSSYDVAMDKYAAQNNLASQQYAAKQQAANNRTALTGSLIQGVTTGAGAALGGWLGSDERLKENIKPVGKLDNGLTVYCYNYKGDDVPQIGLIAQEVREVIPEAVAERDDGYLAVRYDLATENKNGRDE